MDFYRNYQQEFYSIIMARLTQLFDRKTDAYFEIENNLRVSWHQSLSQRIIMRKNNVNFNWYSNITHSVNRREPKTKIVKQIWISLEQRVTVRKNVVR